MSPEQTIEIRRLVVFGLVGSINTAITYALFAALLHGVGLHYNLALILDYAFGSVLGFLTHRASTFADRTHVRQAYGKYVMALVAAFLTNLLALDLIVGQGWLGPLAAQAVALGLATALSYVLQRQWVFRSHHERERFELKLHEPEGHEFAFKGRERMPAAPRQRLAA